MAEPIKFRQYPGRASQLGQNLGQGLMQGLMERRERKRASSGAQQQFLTNIVNAAYKSGQIGPLQAEEAYKRVQAGEGLPEIMKGLRAPQKAQEPSYEKKLEMQAVKQERVAKYKSALAREPKMKQWIDSWKQLHTMPGTISPYTKGGLDYGIWPEGINQMRLSLEDKMKGVDPNWMSYTLPPPEIQRPKGRGRAEMAFEKVGVGIASEGELAARKEYLKSLFKAEGHSEEEIEAKLSTSEDINNLFDQVLKLNAGK